MTPTQRTKCQLLGIQLDRWTDNGKSVIGWWVMKQTGMHSFHILCTPEKGMNPVSWRTKRFTTIDEAIEAAAAPAKHGLAWDI